MSETGTDNDGLTRDTLFNGQVTLFQSTSGYRFSIDPVILANMALPRDCRRICDIGCGCGIMPIILVYRNPEIPAVYGIEIQESLARIARQNVLQNRMTDRIRIIHGDVNAMRTDEVDGPVDLVIANPPHHGKEAGRINPASEKALARHEITMDINSLVAAARRILTPKGRFRVIYPANRIADLLPAMRNKAIEPKTIRFVHSLPGSRAMRVIVEGTANGRPGAEVTEPLYIMDEKGAYTPETGAMFAA